MLQRIISIIAAACERTRSVRPRLKKGMQRRVRPIHSRHLDQGSSDDKHESGSALTEVLHPTQWWLCVTVA